jgi:plastocyanin
MTARHFTLVAVTSIIVGACGEASGSPTYNSGHGTRLTPATPQATPTTDVTSATPSLASSPPTLTTNVGRTVTFTFTSVGHATCMPACRARWSYNSGPPLPSRQEMKTAVTAAAPEKSGN